MSRPSPCRALRCDAPSLTTFSDGDGVPLELCELHGDLLAVGFPLKPPDYPEFDVDDWAAPLAVEGEG